MKKLETGSYSHATLNPRDLNAVAIQILESIQIDPGFNLDNPENFPIRDRLAKLLGDFQDAIGADDEEMDLDYWPDLWNEFSDFLELHFVPDNHYFGAHPGDGSDIGVWPLEDYDSED